jgi:inner membrane protein
MDSVTQFALGAVVGTAVLGKSLGVRRAAITGGLLGTLPDLDVFLPADDPIDSFVGHRGPSHSLIVHLIVAPVIGEMLARCFQTLKEYRARAYIAVLLCLATHALLDAMTIYGTRLFWPVWPEPLGLGSIFIIDPVYTLPLLIVTLWAVFRRNWSVKFGQVVTLSLMISSLYLGWTVVGQKVVEARGTAYLVDRGIEPQLIVAGPTPMNSFFWRMIAVDRDIYYHVYVPIFGSDKTVTAYRHTRWELSVSCWAERAVAGEGIAGILARFADGFYQVTLRDATVLVSDLRMGLYPEYSFQFAIAERQGVVIEGILPRRMRGNRNQPGDMEWLLAGIRGARAIRPAEADQLIKDVPTRFHQDNRSSKPC